MGRVAAMLAVRGSGPGVPREADSPNRRSRKAVAVGAAILALLVAIPSLHGAGLLASPVGGTSVVADVHHPSAVTLAPATTGLIPGTAIIHPNPSGSTMNIINDSNGGPSLPQTASGPAQATLPTSTHTYRIGPGWQGISGLNSSCLQPTYGTNNSPLACLPPDVTASANPRYVMGEVNTAAEIWKTDGTFVSFFTLTNFFTAPSGAGCYLTDPQVLFDNQTQRWFTSVLSVTCGPTGTQHPNVASQIYLGVSQTSNPAGKWFEYVVPNPLTFNLSDQPLLGANDHSLVISANQFPDSALAINTYTGAYFWVLDKAALEQTGCTRPAGLLCSVSYQTWGPYSSMASLHPAHSYGSAPVEYLAGANAYSAGQNGTTTLNFVAVNGTAPHAAATLTNLTIRSTTGPPKANQPNSPGSLNTDDSRIQTGVYQNGVSWWGATDGCTVAGQSGLHDCLRLIDVTTTGAAYSVARDFDYNAGGGQDDYYPGITLNPSAVLALTYAFSSPTAYPSMAVTILKTTTAVQRPTTVVAGTDTEQGGRYGDYCDASPSYKNPAVVWLACEYIQNYSAYVWNTHIQQVTIR